MASVGPQLPSHLMKRKRSPESDNEASSPPNKIHAASPDEIKHRRVLGPALPPAFLDERPLQPVDAKGSEEDSSSDGDDYGPSLPPLAGSTADYEAKAQLETSEEAAIERAKTAKPQREEWMLLPPKDSDWGSRVDPTKLKNRKFASGKGAKAPSEKSGVSAIWTETPEQKRKRLEDEVMGRKESSSSAQNGPKLRKDDAEAAATSRRIKAYNDRNRSASLYEEHNKTGPREKEDDPSKRAFDKEKDIGLGGRIGHVQKKDMLKRAGDFGSRFERGNYL